MDSVRAGAERTAMIDRAQHDRAFRARLRYQPTEAAAQMGLNLRDSEWAGLRDLVYSYHVRAGITDETGTEM